MTTLRFVLCALLGSLGLALWALLFLLGLVLLKSVLEWVPSLQQWVAG
jgi:hypothetical protein